MDLLNRKPNEPSEYDLQAENFLKITNSTVEWEFRDYGLYSPNSTSVVATAIMTIQ